MRRVFSLLVLGSVLCVYVFACAAPAIKVDEGGHACTAIRLGTIPGVAALLLGWLPPYCISWSANLLLVVGSIALLLERFKAAVLWGSAAALVGLTALLFWLFGAFQELLVGYYLWQAGLLLFAIGTLVLRVRFAPQLTPPRPGESQNLAAIYAGHPNSTAFSDPEPELLVATLVEQAAGEARCNPPTHGPQSPPPCLTWKSMRLFVRSKNTSRTVQRHP